MQNTELTSKRATLYAKALNDDNDDDCVFDERLFEADVIIKLESFEFSQSRDFMPNCVSSYLTPFFLDIIQPSELKQFAPSTVSILLALKSSYKPHLNYSAGLFALQLVENCLWQMLALFKFKLSLKYKFGFVNYFTLLVCFYKSYEELTGSEVALEMTKTFKNVSSILRFYVKALVLSGFLKFKNFSFIIQAQKNESYRDDLVAILNSAISSKTPMRLSDMCRILVRRSLKSYESQLVKGLGLSEHDERFLLFDNEFEQFYTEIKAIF